MRGGNGGGGGGGAETAASGGGGSSKRGDACLAEIKRLETNRANRRTLMQKARADRVAEEARNIANGNPGDVDFMGMIQNFRERRAGTAMDHVPSRAGMKICIAIRKRPTNAKEKARKDHDAVSCFNPEVTVHDCKLRVDGISKYLDSVGFRFDHTFGDEDSTDLVYDCTAKPLVPFVLGRGRATVFAYGQTGSGKTFTMVGIQQNATRDLFAQLSEMPNGENLSVHVSFFEIYGGRCQDLLNHRHRCVVREDGKGEVVMAGLEEKEAMDEEGLEALINDGNSNRTTHATESNDQSSRSHAICQISVRESSTGRLYGKLSLIDLAGSERGTDTKSHNRQRRMEGADINKSLLALKECIRALDSESVHVPYRASKLTLVLKDSFTRKGARTVMIATVSPGASAADHTINTLRYADRVKENKVEQFKPVLSNNNNNSNGAVASSVRASPLDNPPPPPVASPPHERNNANNANPASGMSQLKHGERRGTGGGAGALSLRQSAGDFKAGAKAAMDGAADYDRVDPRPTQQLANPKVGAASGSGGGGIPGGGGVLGSIASRRSTLTSRHHRNSSATEAPLKRDSLIPRPSLEPTRGTSMRILRSNAQRDSSEFEQAGAGRGGGWGVGGGEREGGPESVASDTASAASDINYMHESLRQHHPEDDDEEGVVELHHTVQSLFEEEEALLNLHMNVIQENAELLTEEGRLLQQIQGDDVIDYDIDAYATRLSEILDRKMTLMSSLQTRLRNFRGHLEAEERASVRVRDLHVPQY